MKTVLYGPHYQRRYENWLQHLARTGIKVVKTIGEFELCRQVKEADPEIITVVRHHNENTARWRAMAAQSPEQADAAAEEFVREFLDSLIANSAWIDYAVERDRQISG